MLSPLSATRFSYASGTSGTVTVGSGNQVSLITCYSVAGGTLTITPGGGNQSASAGSTITIPAGTSFSRDWAPTYGPLGPGTVLVFASTDSYYVEYALPKMGA